MTGPKFKAKRSWVTVEYVEDLTGYARWTIYRMAREGRIPAYRDGRSIKFDPAELEAWMSKVPKAAS